MLTTTHTVNTPPLRTDNNPLIIVAILDVKAEEEISEQPIINPSAIAAGKLVMLQGIVRNQVCQIFTFSSPWPVCTTSTGLPPQLIVPTRSTVTPRQHGSFKRPRAFQSGTWWAPLSERLQTIIRNTCPPKHTPSQVRANLDDHYMPFVQPKEINQNPEIFQSPPQPDAQSTNILNQTTQHSNVLVHGVVSTARVQVLVDTGAAVTVISGEFNHKVISTSSHSKSAKYSNL